MGTWPLQTSRESVAQLVSEGLLINRSSVRFRLKPENSTFHEFELLRPSIRGTKLLLKVIKAIIIISVITSRRKHSTPWSIWLSTCTTPIRFTGWSRSPGDDDLDFQVFCGHCEQKLAGNCQTRTFVNACLHQNTEKSTPACQTWNFTKLGEAQTWEGGSRRP